MADFELFYWPVPFRGQFVRAVLAWSGADWREGEPGRISAWMDGPPRRMPVPFKGPPVLRDLKRGFVLSQTPAIIWHLGEALGRLPDDAERRALTIKVVCDANDVIDEMTLDGGRQMWTRARWRAFEPRLRTWMRLFEDLGARKGLGTFEGTLLGTDAPGIADVVSATLWTTMTDRLPALTAILEEAAPRLAAHGRRISDLPPLRDLARKSREAFGDVWCGGKIEASLREVLAPPDEVARRTPLQE